MGRRSVGWIAILVAAMAGCRSSPTESGARPNLVIVTVDTLRADHLSAYGYGRRTSPAFDRVAGEGVLFTRAFAHQGSTWPSLTSIMTSMYPGTHGVRRNGIQLEASKQTLAEILKAEGYETAAFLCNMLTAPNRGFDTKETFESRRRDRKATRAALRWLRQERAGPFFLWLHLLAPHTPYSPPRPFKSSLPPSPNN